MAASGATKVAILCGGRSHERAVSLRTGARVEQALHGDPAFDAVLVDVDESIGSVLSSGGFGVAFVALHGRGGEDDTIQRLCENLGLPYTGTRRGPCGAAFDKARAKRLMLAAGVPTPPFITFSEHAIEQFGAGDVRDEAEQLGFPLVVKPARGGSALGTRFVDDAAELPRALIGALSYDQHVLLERHVRGRELSFTIIGGGGAGEPRMLPAVEIVPRHADWFDYQSRYVHGETEFTCPPQDIDGDVLARAGDAARAAYEALDISGFGRVDLLVDEAGDAWVLEVSPVPGLTETSTVSVALDAQGIELEQLVRELIADALAQHAAQDTGEAHDGDDH